MSNLDLALQYAESGMPVIPLHTPTGDPHKPCSCNKADCKSIGKHPRIKKDIEDATTDPDQIKKWWGWWKDANIGIVTGQRLGAFVLDVDPKSGGIETLNRYIEKHGPFDTATVKTGSGGYHFFFAMPFFPVSNTQGSKDKPSYLGPGLDLRGDGGYVVAAGSLHSSGNLYEWVKGYDVWRSAPAWLLDLIQKKRGLVPHRPAEFDALGVIPITEGQRHPQLLSWGAKMRASGMSPEAILAGLTTENELRCDPPKSAEEIQKIAKWLSGREPGAVMAEVETAIHSGRSVESPDEIDDQIEIDIGELNLPKLNRLCWAAVEAGNNPPIIFSHGGVLVRAERKSDTALALQQLNPDMLRHEISRWAMFHTKGMNKDGSFFKRSAKPPLDVIKDLLVTRNPPVPELSMIASVPVFGPSGTLLTTPGYDERSGILYAPPKGFTALPVPDSPSEDELWEARKFIENEVLIDFPFAGEADKANLIALMILPFIRSMIDGSVPMHMIEASMPGSGKGLLLHAALFPGLGADYAVSAQPTQDEEWRKSITSHLLAGQTALIIDNVNHKLESGALANAITSTIWTDRILGGNTNIRAKMSLIFAATGNNPTVSPEIGRRSVPTRLTPATDRPENRTGFHHQDLKEFLLQSRPRLVQCCHILVRYWQAAGCPAPKMRLLGSFERWTHVIGGVLHAAGFVDFLTNYHAYQDAADIERTALASFCDVAYSWMKRQNKLKATARELLEIAERVEGLELGGMTEGGRVRSMGKYLAANKDVFTSYSEPDEAENIWTTVYVIRKRSFSAGQMTWAIEAGERVLETHQTHL